MSERYYSDATPKWSKQTASDDCKQRREKTLTVKEMKELSDKVKIMLAYQKVNKPKPKTEIEKKLTEAYLRIYGKNDLGYTVENINEEDTLEE
jgi:hypothetical protein